MDKNINIFLHTADDILHFFSKSYDGINYIPHKTHETTKLYDKKILEFDIDIDNKGNIGVVILDCEGNFYYNYFDGNIWTSHLLYKLDPNLEEFKHICIKFSLSSPYIVFCWRNLSYSSSWSIVSYYKDPTHWKKEVLNRVYLKENIKPYILIRNIHYQLYFIYLNNNNIIYDLMIKNLPQQSFQWTQPTFLSNCIFLKYFHLDALIDPEDTIHISWLDKHKQNYCIKYVSNNNKKNILSNSIPILEMNIPFTRHQLLYHKKLIICYALTNKNIFYSTKLINDSNWNKPNKLNLLPNSIVLIKIIKSTTNTVIHYNANYILSENLSNITPLVLETIEDSFKNNETDSTYYTTSNKKENFPIHLYDQSIDSFKKIKLELYTKNKELEMKNNLLKSLEDNISFLKKEIKQLNMQNKKYINILHKNNEKYHTNQNKINDKEKNYQNILSDYKLSDQKNKELLSTVETYQHQLEEMQSTIHNINKKNTLLQKKLDTLKNNSFFKRLFH